MSYKTFLTAIALTALMYACQNKTASTAAVVDETSTSALEKEGETALILKLKDPSAYVYESETKQLYHAYYQIDQPEKKVVIQTPDRILILPQKEAWAKGALYDQNNFSWEAQGDQITFKTPENTHILHQISPIVKNFGNESQQIKVTTTLENDKKFVLLERKDAPNIKLQQTDQTEPNQETTYSNDSVTWQEKSTGGLLIINDVENYFTLKD